jgi:hypothetical protein
LGVLKEAGAEDQVMALLARDPAAHAALDDPHGVAMLLGVLKEAGAEDQVMALLARDPAAHAALDPFDVMELLIELREIGAQEQVVVLLDRLPGAGMFQLFLDGGGYEDRFPFGREPNGSPARRWGWEDLD